MKSTVNSWSLFIVFVALQMVMTNWFHVSQFVTLTILPAAIMCLPLSISTLVAMLIAFATGLSVDLLAEGVVGLNALALVPVAAMRKPLVSLIIGGDAVERAIDFNFRKNGFTKVTIVILIPLIIFLLIYIIADGAGVRPFWFNLGRFIASLACDLVLCLLVTNTLNPEDRR